MTKVDMPNKWDHESDVVIIGGGTTGLPAAVKVAEAGLKATVLETRPQCGGSLSMIVGGCIFAGIDEQKEAGIEDSPDKLYQDMVNNAGSDPKLARAYVDNQLEAYRMLKAQGIVFDGGFALVPGQSVKRGGLGSILGKAHKLSKAFEERARDKGSEILYKHRAQRLITDPQKGRVIGVTVLVNNETKYFKARKAVIIATGGFGYNREMVAEYAPHMADCIPKMPVGHQGDGLKMALDIGAATKDIGISVAGSWPVCAETHSRAIWVLDKGGIMVNIHGKRFYDESSSEGFYGRMTEAAMRQPGGVYWVIYNDNILENVGKIMDTGRDMGHVRDIEKCKKVKADTIEELAEKAGVDQKELKEAIDKYNNDIDSFGYDTVFGRRWQWGMNQKPLVKLIPPLYATKCVTSLTSLKGGIKINEFCQVLDNYGEVIPRLYAGGEVIGGLYTKSYLLGTMTTFAMAQGIIAGRNAALELSLE
jgi:fumarate reductase flavoprotein subunit